MLSITSVLTLFILLIISSFVFFISKKIKIPYTVLLVLVGILLVPLVQLPLINPVFGFIKDFVLTPELLFYIFLPILIFESAFNMNMRKMIESAWSITSLAIVGLIISALIVAIALFFLLPLFGLNIPFIIALLFGAIISSTDPVAVLALFKEFGAPKRLTLIFEGESLFNDGTAVALFMVVLAIAESGFHGAGTVFEGILLFILMVAFGIAFGLGMALLFSRGLQRFRSNEFVSITFLIVSAHVVFILSELINANPIMGIQIHVSSIIATTVSSLFLGNYARHSLSPKSDEYLNKSIEHLAFVANSLVFIMAGILFASIKIDFAALLMPIIVTVLVVATARAISVYAVTNPLNKMKLEAPTSKEWQVLLSWGSLRGALAIIVVMLIPDTLRPDGWQYTFSPKEFLLSLTIGCILATLFIKALTIGTIIKKLQIDKPSPFQEAYQLDLGLYYLYIESSRLEKNGARGYIDKKDYKIVNNQVQTKITDALANRELMTKEYGYKLFEQTLRHIAMDIEIKYLKELYNNHEVDEIVYRKIKGKLNLQKETIEHGKFEDIDASLYMDRKDVFDKLVALMRSGSKKQSEIDIIKDKYQYYRAQSIIARKVVKIINQIQKQSNNNVFDESSYSSVIKKYTEYIESNAKKMQSIIDNNQGELSEYITEFARKSLHSSGNKALAFMSTKGMSDESTLEEVERIFSI